MATTTAANHGQITIEAYRILLELHNKDVDAEREHTKQLYKTSLDAEALKRAQIESVNAHYAFVQGLYSLALTSNGNEILTLDTSL